MEIIKHLKKNGTGCNKQIRKLEYFFIIQFYKLIKETHRHAFSASRTYSKQFIHS